MVKQIKAITVPKRDETVFFRMKFGKDIKVLRRTKTGFVLAHPLGNFYSTADKKYRQFVSTHRTRIGQTSNDFLIYILLFFVQ